MKAHFGSFPGARALASISANWLPMISPPFACFSNRSWSPPSCRSNREFPMPDLPKRPLSQKESKVTRALSPLPSHRTMEKADHKTDSLIDILRDVAVKNRQQTGTLNAFAQSIQAASSTRRFPLPRCRSCRPLRGRSQCTVRRLPATSARSPILCR